MKFNICCEPFDVAHTGENIRNLVLRHLREWGVENKVSVCLRDNAANMTSAFQSDDCLFTSTGCFLHSLQLAIKDEIFSLKSVENVIGKCHKLHSHANMSTKFYTELYKQQKIQMNLGESECLRLKHDVQTRWDSSYDMFDRAVYLKPALVSTLANTPNLGIEFSAKEWELMDKVRSGEFEIESNYEIDLNI